VLSELLWIILPCAIVPGLLAFIITWRARPTVTAAVLGGMLGPALLFAVIAYQQHRASAQKEIISRPRLWH
jgi:Na+/H+ antiporter NhaA